MSYVLSFFLSLAVPVFCLLCTSPVCKDNKFNEYGFDEIDPTPYIIPSAHPLKTILDEVFYPKDVINSDDSLDTSNFEILVTRRGSGLRVVKHPQLKGYLVKLFLKSDLRWKWRILQQNLIQRCATAAKIRTLIAKHKIEFFTVPEKWLYEVPDQMKQTFVLIVQDMRLVSRKKSEEAWRTKISKDHLDELYIILSRGYGSMAISQNIAYTKDKTFSFIDTEFPKREFSLRRVCTFLSFSKQKYWEKLIQSD